MAIILIIEDDQLLNKGIAKVMTKEGHQVEQAYTYDDGLSIFLNRTFHLILLDVNLHEKNGMTLLKHIREKSDIPVIFITGNDTEEDMIKGFEIGCDDYIPKPFSLLLLKQRVQAVLRRTMIQNLNEKNIFIYKDLSIDYDKRQVIKSEPIKLTKTEYKLIEILTKNCGQVVTREAILEKLWDIDGQYVDENAVSVNIRRLRKKLENDPKKPEYIHTVFGVGYTWGD